GKAALGAEVGVLLCDVGDAASLAAMARQTRLVLSCVGPYRFLGEPVVEACVENGASCIDISGEPQVCTLTAVESFLKVNSGPEGVCIHDGTWKSAVYGLADEDNLRKLRKKIGYAPVPVVGTKLKRRYKKHKISFNARAVTENTFFPQVQYGAYVNIGGLGSVIKLMFAGILFLLLVKFSFGRKLLTKYPEFFSAGLFTKKGPTQKQMDGTSFTMTFFGEGYSEGQDPQNGKPNVKICTEVKGPGTGGVYSPGAAFSKTKLIDRLNKRGVEFSVISKPEV
ncbi:SCPDL oxidoreductase, partial [Halcyon senegalensis]|nr:SCPDL oxidoreductase [Halcyon senegalensis]